VDRRILSGPKVAAGKSTHDQDPRDWNPNPLQGSYYRTASESRGKRGFVLVPSIWPKEAEGGGTQGVGAFVASGRFSKTSFPGDWGKGGRFRRERKKFPLIDEGQNGAWGLIGTVGPVGPGGRGGGRAGRPALGEHLRARSPTPRRKRGLSGLAAQAKLRGSPIRAGGGRSPKKKSKTCSFLTSRPAALT